MNTDLPAKSKSKSRWFQFSLRTLLIFVTLCAVACSWFTVKMRQARRQRESVAKLTGRRISCNVQYDYQRDSSGNLIPNAQAPGPAWLRHLLGIDFFSNVTEVWGRGNLTDADLASLKSFPQLSIFFFRYSQITDEGLRTIQGLTQLQFLGLPGSKITNAGLRHLKGLSQLKRLDLKDTNIGDAGLEYIKEMTNLEFLDLSYTNITDAGLEQLKELHKLQGLRLTTKHAVPTVITGDGINNLQKKLPKLEIELMDYVIEM
jgi:hypothetical protein